MKLSPAMKKHLVSIYKDDCRGGIAMKTHGTVAALVRRGLLEFGELYVGRHYRVLMTEEGRTVAAELAAAETETPAPAEAPATEAAQAETPYSDYAFPADVERVAKAYPVGTRAEGLNPRGERVAGVVTGYVQYGSANDGYTTAAEIEHEESTGDYAMLCYDRDAQDTAQTEIPAPQSEYARVCDELPKGAPVTARDTDGQVITGHVVTHSRERMGSGRRVCVWIASGPADSVGRMVTADRVTRLEGPCRFDALTERTHDRLLHMAEKGGTITATIESAALYGGLIAREYATEERYVVDQRRITLTPRGWAMAKKLRADRAAAAAPKSCRRPLHRACACVRPAGHTGACNCTFADGAPTAPAAPAAPDVSYKSGRGWYIDGTLYADGRDAAVALYEHPGNTDPDPLDRVLDVQAPALSAVLPDGMDLTGDRNQGYGFACTLNGCTRTAEAMDWPGSAYRSALEHLKAKHMDPTPQSPF